MKKPNRRDILDNQETIAAAATAQSSVQHQELMQGIAAMTAAVTALTKGAPRERNAAQSPRRVDWGGAASASGDHPGQGWGMSSDEEGDDYRGLRGLRQGNDDDSHLGRGDGYQNLFEPHAPSQRLSPEEEAAKDEARAKRAADRKMWNDTITRATWVLVGAPPMDHSLPSIQGILGQRVLVTKTVFDQMNSLHNFKVSTFGQRGGSPDDKVPLVQRLEIMCFAVVAVLRNSIPVEGHPDYSVCTARVRAVRTKFKMGVRMLKDAAARCGRAMNDPNIIAEITGVIDRDMATWTDQVAVRATEVRRASNAPPKDTAKFGPPMVPAWKELECYITSQQLQRHDAQLAARKQPSGGTAKGSSSGRTQSREPCHRFLEGRCDKSASACRFSHASHHLKRKAGTVGGNAAKTAKVAPGAVAGKKLKKVADADAAEETT